MNDKFKLIKRKNGRKNAIQPGGSSEVHPGLLKKAWSQTSLSLLRIVWLPLFSKLLLLYSSQFGIYIMPQLNSLESIFRLIQFGMVLSLSGMGSSKMPSISSRLPLIISPEDLLKYTSWVKYGILWLILILGFLILAPKSKNNGIMALSISYSPLSSQSDSFSLMSKNTKSLIHSIKKPLNNTKTMLINSSSKSEKVYKHPKAKYSPITMKPALNLCLSTKNIKKSEKVYQRSAKSKDSLWKRRKRSSWRFWKSKSDVFEDWNDLTKFLWENSSFCSYAISFVLSYFF